VGAIVSNKEMFKLKKAFAKNVTAMHDSEVFGMGSDNSWNCLFKDYVILDVLETYKKKCYNPCFEFTVLGTFRDNAGTGIEIVIDDFSFDLVVGDILNIISESLELLDTVDYEIESVEYYADMHNSDKNVIISNGFSQNSVKITLMGFDNLTDEGATGNLFLKTPKEIIFEDRELLQEDINCLIEKTC